MKIFSSLLLCFFSLATVAQVRTAIVFTGKVTDAVTGSPLPGATIMFTDAKIGSIANEQGVFTIRNFPPGHHLVEVSHLGYTTIVEHIDISKDTEKDFKLSPSVVENQGVTVTGVTSATNTRHAPIPVTLVRKVQLMQTASTNIVDALSRQPGISQVSTGPAISKPVIRGLGYNRVVVINDGSRQEGQQWGDEHGIEIDELSIQRAEILKGPASLLYGSDALAGVINFITNTPVAEGTVKGNIYSSIQTNNNQAGLNASLSGNQNGFNWNAYGSYKSARDYRNSFDGRVLNSRFNEKNFGGYAGINKSWGYTHLIFSSFNQEVGLVEGERDSATGSFLAFGGSPLERIATASDYESREPMVPFQNVRHYKIVSDNSFRAGNSRFKLNLGFQNNLRKELGNPEDPSEAELFFDLRTTNYNLQWRLPENNNWETAIGLSGMFQDNQNKGEEAIIPNYGLFDAGLFFFAQKMYQKLTISGGVRYDNRSIDAEGMMEGSDIKFSAFERSYSNVSASAGLSYHPSNNLNFKFNMARGFRSPTLSELASNGAHEGTNRYEYGRLDLESERSLQADLGVDVDYDHISFSLSAFTNRMKDFIFYRRLENISGGDSLVILDGEELEAFQYSQQNARLSGLEFNMDLHPHPFDWLHFENTISFVRGKFDEAIDGSNNLPMIPATRWISELRGDFPKAGKSLRNFYIKVEIDNSFDQEKPFTGYNTETMTRGYTLLNAGLGTDVTRKDATIFSIHFAAVNITDEAYQNHLSRLKYAAVNNVTGRQGVFNTGRNFSIKLNIPLSF